jgi:aldose 1-epimerase
MDDTIIITTLSNKSGMTVELLNIGAVIYSIRTPDKNGRMEDVVLGYRDLEIYRINPSFLGCVAGRYANRIANARFELNGVAYPLYANNNGNHLHGGKKGFDKVLWTLVHADEHSAEYTYESADMEEGYPGKLDVRVRYTLTEDNGLEIHYEAVSDKDTIVNLTNHSYFNLSGNPANDIGGHWLQIFADACTPVNEKLIPTGEIRPVAGTPLDFTQSKPIGKEIGADDEQLKLAQGYDHNFVLRGQGFKKAAEVYEPVSGRCMEVSTTKPGVQFYSGNNLKDFENKDGAICGYRCGFCLETQYYPDSPNQKGFSDAVLKAGEKYAHTTLYRFSAK